MKLTALFALAVAFVAAEYTADDDVVVLTKDNFKSLISDTNDLWLVEFYAPWCGHCKALEPDWKKLATALKGIVNVGALDMTENQEIGEPYGVTGFPTIKAFSVDRDSPIGYEGGDRSLKSLAKFALAQVKDVVKNRLGIKKKAKKASSSKVVTLTDGNFDELVLQSTDLWLVEFYAPWCGHCKNLAPEWKKAAAALDGKVKLGALDATKHTAMAGKYEVKGYPTIKAFFDEDRSEAEEYNGGRTANAIVEWAQVRGGLETDGAAAGGGGEEKPAEEVETKSIVLTAAAFEEQVLRSDDLWLIEFFAPWCGHCKSLAPKWAAASIELDGKVKLGTVDATVENDLSTKYEVTAFPTLKFFSRGDVTALDGARETSSLVSAALDKLENHNKLPREVQELVSQETLDTECATGLCVIGFLPHILDTGAEGRNAYIQILKDQAQAFRTKNIGYLWTSALEQEKIETALEVSGMGYPAAAVVNIKKGRFLPYQSAFTTEHLSEFLTAATKGSASSVKMGALSVETTTAWDGKDGEAPSEDKEEL